MKQKLKFNAVYLDGAGAQEPLEALLDGQTLNASPTVEGEVEVMGRLIHAGAINPFAIGQYSNVARIDIDDTEHVSKPILTVDEFNNGFHPDQVYHYVIIYAADGIPKKGVGDACEDFLNGIPHFDIGRNVGIVKSIKFQKTDQPYIKEARYFRDGFDDLAQLREPYMVKVEMYGNPRIFPGTLIYINPTGLAPGKIGLPHEKSGPNGDSFAWTFGFGGYHLVTDVENSLANGKFETNITAKFIYRGGTANTGTNATGDKDGSSAGGSCKTIEDAILTEMDTYVQETKEKLGGT
jgi:hypothetical protein